MCWPRCRPAWGATAARRRRKLTVSKAPAAARAAAENNGRRAGQQRSWQQHDGWEEEAAGPKIPNAKSILPRDEPTIWFEAASTLAPLAAAPEEASPDVVQQRRRQAERLLLVEEQVGWRVGGCCLPGWLCCLLPAARCAMRLLPCPAPPAHPNGRQHSQAGSAPPRGPPPHGGGLQAAAP